MFHDRAPTLCFEDHKQAHDQECGGPDGGYSAPTSVPRQTSVVRAQGKSISARLASRSGLFLNKRDGVFHPSEHTLLTATETLALGGRQAPRIMFPFAQNLELHLPRQRRMRNNVLRFHEKGFGML